MGRGRPVPRRGRPPKDAESAKRLAQLRKPKYLYSGQKQQQSKLSNSSANNSSRSRSKKKQPWEGESDEDEYTSTSFSRISRSAYFEDDDEEDKSLMSFGDDGKSAQWDEDDMEEDNDDEDEASGSPSQPSNSVDSKLKMGRFLRARSPPRFEEDKLADMPPLNLPESSADLLLPPHLASKYLMEILSVYEILNQFKFQLRLSAFRLEDFISSLLLNENNALLSEIHINLMKTLIREDETNSTLFGSQDVKDSIGIYLYNCDPLTWPTVLRMYIISRRREETPETKETIDLLIQNKKYEEYPIGVPFDFKVKVLKFLCDTFLETNVARDEILNGEAGVRHDDHCRRCHKLGDLLCCDRCSSVWHLGCLEPPMKEVPEDEWVCSICKQMAKETGCANEDGTIASFGDDEGLFLRRYTLGWDRYGNKYWWLCRRLIIEFNNEDQKSEDDEEQTKREDKCIYISTKKRFLELMKALDKDEYEKDLYNVLSEIKEEIFKAMERTEKMTKDALKTTGITRAMKTWIEFETEASEPVVKEETIEKGEDKTAANNNSISEGIMTRLKTGSLREKSSSGSDNGKEDDKDMIMVFDEALDPHFLIRMSKRDAVARGLFYKLGMENKNYINIFSINMLALNKHQLAEERDKKRHLSHKFSLTPLSEFKWQGTVYGPFKPTIVQTLRQTLVQFENQLAAPFMHPNWSLHRQNWLKAVSMCNQPKDFTLALSILEAAMKPVLFNPVWNEALGHTILDRNTNLEREDRKKDEKRERREFMEEQEMIIRTTGGVKYSIMPHRGLQLEKAGNIWFGFGTQSGSIGFGTTGGVGEGGGRGVQALWKQRGEEYRVSGSGGWLFISIARSRFPLPDNGERADEIEIPEELAGEVIEVSFIDVSGDLRKDREKRSFYQKYRPYKNKRKGLKVIESYLDRRLLLEEAILHQKLKAEEDDRIKPEDIDDDDYDNSCYSPLCRTAGIGAFDNLCYCISCRRRQKDKRIKLQEEKVDREEREKRYKVAKEEQEKGNTQDFIGSCREKVYLNKVEKREVKEGDKEEIKYNIIKTSGKRILGKGQLPPCNRFTTLKGKKKSIFVLPKHELRRLSRNANLREVSGFNYTGKFNKYLWPYGISPRPLFRYCWLWRNTLPQGYHNLNLVAAQLRTIWACIRWDDMQVKPPPSGNNTITNENEVITTELLKRRDLAPFGIRSEYLVRKIIVPLVNDDPMDEKDTPYGPGRGEESYNRTGRRIREGLRERKKKIDEEEERRRRGPSVTESWVGEEELELWEIKMFGERLEKQQQMKESEKRKQIEESLKKQREELAAKRLKTTLGTPTTGKVTSLISGTKRIFNSRTPTANATVTPTLATTPTTPQIVTQATQYAVIKTNGGQTFKVPVSALQGKTVGQQIIIKQGNNLAASTTATIISTGTPPTVTTPLTPAASSTLKPVTSTVSLPNFTGNIKLRTVGGSPTVRPLILSGSTLQQTPTNNGQRIQIIKPVVGTTPQTIKTVNASGLTTPAIASATTTPVAAGQQQSPQSTIQIPLRFPDGRMQIIQIPLSMFSSTTQPIQIAIPSSVSQQTTQTVTVTSTPQLVATNASTAQTPVTPQSIKIITNTSNLSPAPSTATPNPPTTNVTRFITMKSTPQVTPTTTSTTTISLASTSTTPQTNITEQVAQQLKTGTIQLKLNQTALTPQAGTITSTNTATPVTPSGTTTLRIAPTSTGQTLTALTSSTVATTVVSNTSTSPVVTTTSSTAVLASPAKTASIVRTSFQSPVGTRILVQQPNNTATTIHKVTAPSLKIITPSSQESTSKTSQSDGSNKPFVLTQEIQDRIVRQALLNTNPSTSPEVQQKLLAWQKKQQQPGQVVVTPAIIDSSGTGRTVTPSSTGRNKGVKRARNTSTTTTITPTTVPAIQLTGDDEENRRLYDCQAVLVGILDKIEKDEKMELRRKKAKENQFQSKWKSLLTKKKEILNEQAEILKRDIARKKSLMKEKLRKEIQAEMNKESPVKRKETTPNNKVNSNGATNNTTTASLITNSSTTEATSTPKRRKLSDSSSEVSRPPLNKIRIKITPLNPKGSTGDSNTTNTSTTGNKNKKLYCICKTAYDSSRFMVGCDDCHNWFHTDCLGLDEETVKKKKSWICNDCRDSDEENDHGDGDEEEEDDEGSTPESSDAEQEVQQPEPQPKTQSQPQPQPEPQLKSPPQQPPQLQPLPQQQSPQLPPLQQLPTQSQTSTTHEPEQPEQPPPLLISHQPTVEAQTTQQPQQPQQIQKPQEPIQQKQQSKVKAEPKTEPKAVPKVEPKVIKTPKKQVKKEIKGKRSTKKDQASEEEDESRLYCMCRQPYDESLFYIQCDSCQDWLHGKCVGIVSKEAQLLDTYNCPRCAPNSLINYCNQKKLDSKDFTNLKGLLKELKSFRSAWPFLKPVDATVVPDYYSIIKKPMDMATMERKLESTAYATLAQFIGDLTLICDNCRYYNDNKSTFTTCANLLESFFLQRIKSFRQQMLQNK